MKRSKGVPVIRRSVGNRHQRAGRQWEQEMLYIPVSIAAFSMSIQRLQQTRFSGCDWFDNDVLQSISLDLFLCHTAEWLVRRESADAKYDARLLYFIRSLGWVLRWLRHCQRHVTDFSHPIVIIAIKQPLCPRLRKRLSCNCLLLLLVLHWTGYTRILLAKMLPSLSTLQIRNRCAVELFSVL